MANACCGFLYEASRLSCLDDNVLVNAGPSLRYGQSQQPGGQQQVARQAQSQSVSAPAAAASHDLPPGYYNYYPTSNPPLLSGGYSYPPAIVPTVR